MAAKLLPAYIEYFAREEDLLGDGAERRHQGDGARRSASAYDTRNAIEDVKSVQGQDIEITQGRRRDRALRELVGQDPMVANISACIDFSVTTASAAAQ